MVRKAPALRFFEITQSKKDHPRCTENALSALFITSLFDTVLEGSKTTAWLVVPEDPEDADELSQEHLHRLATRYFHPLSGTADRESLGVRTELIRLEVGFPRQTLIFYRWQ